MSIDRKVFRMHIEIPYKINPKMYCGICIKVMYVMDMQYTLCMRIPLEYSYGYLNRSG